MHVGFVPKEHDIIRASYDDIATYVVTCDVIRASCSDVLMTLVMSGQRGIKGMNARTGADLFTWACSIEG